MASGHDRGRELRADLWAESSRGWRENASLVRHMPLRETEQPMGNITTVREVLDFSYRHPEPLNQRVQGSGQKIAPAFSL
jgi:hypothetical protein